MKWRYSDNGSIGLVYYSICLEKKKDFSLVLDCAFEVRCVQFLSNCFFANEFFALNLIFSEFVIHRIK